MSTCREEILAAAAQLTDGSKQTFTPAVLLAEMKRRGTRFTDSTIRTHVTSLMCANAPVNHPTTYRDLERVGPGQYRLLNHAAPATRVESPDSPEAVDEEVLAEPPAGSSKTQRQAERVILDLLSNDLGIVLQSERIHLPSGAYVDVDGVSHEPPALVEVWAHQGSPKVAQRHKVLADALKLNYVASVLGLAHRKILCLSDEAAAAPFLGRSWYAGALAHADIEVQVVELPEEWRERIRAAQRQQYR